MKGILIATLIISITLLTAVSVLAQEESSADTATITEETISESPGLLPGNPFYFLKEWGRGIQRFFISDPIKRVEFELNITTEKGEELRKVSELNREEAIGKAIQNYEKAMTRLQEQFEKLEGLSENPNTNELLQKVAERTEEHQQLFQELMGKFETFKSELQPLQENWGDVITPLFQNAGNIESLQNRVTEMLQEGNPGYGVMSEIMKRVGQEIQAQPTEESVATSSEIGAQPYPMPVLDTNKWDSIMLDIRKTFNMGQTKYAIQPEVCADVYIPVCGVDGKIYSNECYATRAGVNVAYEGECRE